MTEEILYSLVVRDISVTMDEDHIKSELMRRYNGVARVTRMFFDDEEGNPKNAVQVDFTSTDDPRKILQEGNIVIGGICRRVYAIKKPEYQRSYKKQRQNPQYTTKPLTEEDLVNMFNEQKKLLTEVMNSFDNKLNNAVTLRQDNRHKTAQPVLSNNAQQSNV